LKNFVSGYVNSRSYKYYTFQKFIDYIHNGIVNQGFTRYRDFVDILGDYHSMCDKMGTTPSTNLNYLKQTHDVVARNYSIHINEIEDNAFKNVYADIKEYTPANSVYGVYKPTKGEDVKMEGVNLNHCVASYIKKIIDGDCLIMFLRTQEKQQESLLTMELRDNRITQVRGASNRAPSEEEALFIEQYAKANNLEVSY
jgi:hypothetical protein